MKNTLERDRERWFVNSAIRVPKVICINSDDKNLGALITRDALKLAQEQGLDLVQLSPPSKDKPPTCKIMDFSKFKYETSKKKKEADKKQRESIVKVKEIKFKPTTGAHDLEIKAKQAEKFLQENIKVKIAILFVGRAITHQELGTQTLEQFLSFLPENSFKIDGNISWEGKELTLIIMKP
jgi:translation initiation factor IF-3